MAVPSAVRWAAGVGVLLSLSLLPTQCVRWEAEEAAREAAGRIQEVEREAGSLRLQRDSARAAVAVLKTRVPVVKERLVYVRSQIPPTPPAVPGCEACEERAGLLEQALGLADSVIVAQEGLIAGLHTTLALAEQEIDTLRAGLREAKAALERLAAPRPVLKTSFLRKLLPTAQAGYGVVLAEGTIRHGPGLHVGWRVAF